MEEWVSHNWQVNSARLIVGLDHTGLFQPLDDSMKYFLL